jgi:hypothetical protein
VCVEGVTSGSPQDRPTMEEYGRCGGKAPQRNSGHALTSYSLRAFWFKSRLREIGTATESTSESPYTPGTDHDNYRDFYFDLNFT